MTDARSHSSRLSEPLLLLVALLTLTTVLAAQSLYAVLIANQEFLALRLQTKLQLLEIILLFNWLPALAALALWVAVRWRMRFLADGFLAVFYALLFLGFLWHLHNRYWSQPTGHVYWLWCLPAAAIGVLLVRYRGTWYSTALVLSPLIVVLPALFLYRAWPTGQTHTPAPSAAAETSLSADRPLPPIVLIVFDELSLDVLLDDAGAINPEKFPHFARLAAESYWFPQATANADETDYSLSVLLTGNYPLGRGPTYSYYPDNLFNWLASYYQIYAYEAGTRFCDPQRFHCVSATARGSGGQIEFLRDVSLIYLAMVLPQEMDVGIPDIQRTWGPFRDSRGLILARLERFRKFMATLASVPMNLPVLVYFHHLLPHSPYILDESGRIHEREPDYFDARFGGDQALLSDLARRYKQQTIYLDGELGQLLDELKKRGLYDKCFLVVTADHGVSDQLAAPGRALTEVDGTVLNAEPLLRVPLFIKLPQQRHGVVAGGDVQHIDIVPTLADVLALQVPWKVVGRSIFQEPRRARHLVVFSTGRRRYEFASSLDLTPATAPIRQ
jgi:hypothetical protein